MLPDSKKNFYALDMKPAPCKFGKILLNQSTGNLLG